jgi:predicted  nucleic acid-binding Zn-ribbon protein
MFTSVFDAAGKVLDTLPTNLHRQLGEDLLESAPDLHSRFFPNAQVTLAAPQSDASAPLAIASPGPSVSVAAAATSPESYQANLKVSEPPTQPNPVESGKTRPSLTSSIELFQLFDDASHYIRGIEEERDRLRADLTSRSRQAESLDATLAAVREERDGALERLARAELTSEALNSRIGELSTELQKARDDSSSAWTMIRDTESRAVLLNARVAELTGEKQRLTDEATKEKEALARQVQGTAETRIDEVKKDIGFAVRRVVRDIPDKSTKVSPESAQRIFIRLHEVLSELERRGIRVKGE